MKFWKVGLAAVLLGYGSVASAAYVDIILDGSYMQAGDSVTNTHDVTDDGFVPILTPVYNAQLTFAFSDDLCDGRWCLNPFEPESAEIDINSLWTINVDEFQLGWPADVRTYTFSGIGDLLVLLDIWWDGRLTYTITGTGGDFYFLGSKLAVNVPEPASLALLGLGLLGMGYARRRKAS